MPVTPSDQKLSEPDSPLFSVAIVCLNAAEHLAEALESVLAQRFSDFELVLVDGGSVDSTLEIVRSHEPRFIGRMRWISEPDDGIYSAMNKALGMATGRYIVYLGADDRLALDALASVAEAIADEAEPDIVCGGVRVFGRGMGWTERPKLVMRRGLPKSAPSRHQSIYARIERIKPLGGFDTTFPVAADYDLYVRLKQAGATEILIDHELAEFRLGGISSRNALATARDYRDVRVARGASALIEQLVMHKSALGAALFALSRRLFGASDSGGE
ncbi:MAG: glycosyltransferase [Coriobacteriia bacterium]|nr:glycosyltransferase [Coriobacteriia bacterium]